jgi:hypothetical protein
MTRAQLSRLRPLGEESRLSTNNNCLRQSNGAHLAESARQKERNRIGIEIMRMRDIFVPNPLD